MKRIVALAVFCFSALPISGLAEIYKWVDEKGVVNIRDTPPPEGVKAKIVNPQPSYTGDASTGQNRGGEKSPAKSSSDSPVKSPSASKHSAPKVEIYFTKWCPSCKTAINYLDAKGIPYVKYDIEENKAAADRFHNVYNQTSIPFTVIGDVKILGFSKPKFDEALGLKSK